MDKLTINELKGYLGTGLKFQLTIDRTEDFCEEDWYSEDKFKKGAIWELIGIVQAKDLNIPLGDGYLDGFLFKNDLTYCNFNNGIKPFLYNLSSLTEYREDLGFVPIEELQRLFEFDDDFEITNHLQILLHNLEHGYYYFPPNFFLNLYEKLYEWHFDVHNLIGRNLAINLKTLKYE
jgi:hypothetical protein